MFLRNRSIKKRLTLINTSIILLALTLLTTISYLYIRQYTINKTRDYESRLLSQISSNIDDQLEQFDLHTYGILTNVELKRTLEYYDLKVADKLSTTEIESLLVSAMFARRDIASIELFDLGGNNYNTAGIRNFSETDFHDKYEKALAAKGKLVYLPSSSNNIIQAIRLISNHRLQPVGVIVFNLRQSFFQDILEKGKGDSRGEIIILDSDQTIIAATNKELVNSKSGQEMVSSKTKH